MYLDIDHFKTINDSMGHDTGDAVLKAFAGRLRGCLRAVDTIARIGGDEFLIILEELLEEENAVAIATKIVATMQPVFSLGEHTLHLSTSIGVAFFNGQETDVDRLIKQADTALYQAKAAGRNRYEVIRVPVA
jgi:diguanylate cyclase (GGDEF)-like protein